MIFISNVHTVCTLLAPRPQEKRIVIGLSPTYHAEEMNEERW